MSSISHLNAQGAVLGIGSLGSTTLIFVTWKPKVQCLELHHLAQQCCHFLLEHPRWSIENYKIAHLNIQGAVLRITSVGSTMLTCLTRTPKVQYWESHHLAQQCWHVSPEHPRCSFENYIIWLNNVDMSHQNTQGAVLRIASHDGSTMLIFSPEQHPRWSVENWLNHVDILTWTTPKVKCWELHHLSQQC